MAKFRAKPVVIDAWKIKGGEADGELAYAVVDGRLKYCEDGSVLVLTPEGEMQALVGDWIVRAGCGALYVRNPYTFAATYDPVVPGPPNTPKGGNIREGIA
jgi:hypothetical protein